MEKSTKYQGKWKAIKYGFIIGFIIVFFIEIINTPILINTQNSINIISLLKTVDFYKFFEIFLHSLGGGFAYSMFFLLMDIATPWLKRIFYYLKNFLYLILEGGVKKVVGVVVSGVLLCLMVGFVGLIGAGKIAMRGVTHMHITPGQVIRFNPNNLVRPELSVPEKKDNTPMTSEEFKLKHGITREEYAALRKAQGVDLTAQRRPVTDKNPNVPVAQTSREEKLKKFNYLISVTKKSLPLSMGDGFYFSNIEYKDNVFFMIFEYNENNVDQMLKGMSKEEYKSIMIYNCNLVANIDTVKIAWDLGIYVIVVYFGLDKSHYRYDLSKTNCLHYLQNRN